MNRQLLCLVLPTVGLVAIAQAQAQQPSSRGRTPSSAATAQASDTAAIVAGAPISTKQIDEKLGSRLMQIRTQEYRLRRGVLEEVVTAMLLDRESAARKISTADLIATEVEAKTTLVTEEEVRAIYGSSRDRMGALSEADAVKSIMAGMNRQRTTQRRAEFTASLKRRYGVRLLLDPPRVNVDAPVGPALGPSDAVITLTEFSDFQCPYCARSATTVRQLVNKYPGKVRLVFQDFPLPIHKDAQKAAEAGACAHEQGRFWMMHDRLYQNQNNLSVAELRRYAMELGLDAAAFNACLDGGKHAADWKRTKVVGEGYGVTGTPAFFVNGIPIFGAAPLQTFTQTIDDELARVAQSGTAPKTAPARQKSR